jgi:hypothetical protein
VLLASIRSSIDNGFTVFFEWVPHVLGFIAVLLVGWIIARILGKLTWRGTRRAGLDRVLHGGPGGSFLQRAVPKPSWLVGRIVFWAVMLGAFSIAASVLGVAALTTLVGAIWAYLPNVLAAVLIFLAASLISGAVVAVVRGTMADTPLGRIVATGVPILVMTIATFMILNQLQIAKDIVNITYMALVGAIALGSALAFGLGGRDVARQILEGAYEKGQENKGQFRRDLDTGISRGREQVAPAGRDVPVGAAAGTDTGPTATTRITPPPPPEPGTPAQ